MFVPIIPVVPNTTIVNKTIVYSDTILNIKEKGVNIQISSIEGIKENELESCLKIIFENNKDITFYTIQYSKNNNKLYFYTNKEINTASWKKSKTRNFEQLKGKEILNEIKNILNQEINQDENSISLYNVSCLMKEMKKNYENLKNNNHYLENSFEYVIIYDFDYNTDELKIGIKSLDNIYEMRFSKENGDLFITKSDYYNSQKILNSLGNNLSQLYDKFMEFKDFKTEQSYGVKTINSSFYSNVCSLEVSFFTSSSKEYSNHIFNNGFEVKSYSYSSNYGYECNSVNTLNIIKGNEEELFKRIFVKIEDMPKWCQSHLYKMRKQELYKKKTKQKHMSLKEKLKKIIKTT